MLHAGFHADGLRIALRGGNKVSEEDRQRQIDCIMNDLKSLDDEALLDVADHLHWGVLQFYQPSTEMVIPKRLYDKILSEAPHLLI